MSANVIFFKSIPYFFPQRPVTTSESIPLAPSVPLSAPAPAHVPDVSTPVSSTNTTELHAPNLLQNFGYVYTHWPKVPAFESVLTDSSPVEGPFPLPVAPLSNLNVPIALAKVNDPCIDHPISYFIFYDRLNPFFLNLTCLCLLSLFLGLMRQYWCQPRRRL